MADNKDFIEEQAQLFKNNLEQALEVAVSPEDIRWAVFSTGSIEIEEAVLDTLVEGFLTNIEGLFIYRVDTPRECLKILKEATAELESQMVKATLAQKNDYVLKFGVPADE